MGNTLKACGLIVAMLVAASAGAQDVRPADSSHVNQALPGMTSALAAVLNRSCGDCHSNTMVPGWYTRVPPFSTVMARAAKEGRKAVNFSEWTGYSPEQQRAFLLASCEDATLGKMPMKSYLRFRGDARLSAHDVETICSAARQAEATPVTSAALQSRKDP